MWTEINTDPMAITDETGAVLRFRRRVDALRALLALSWQSQCGRDVRGRDAAIAALDSVAFTGWRSVAEAVRS